MTTGLNPYPGNGWDALPNRLLDPDFDDGSTVDDEEPDEFVNNKERMDEDVF